MSPRAAWRLESLGFRDVYEYRPGKIDWIAAGLPTVRATEAEPRVIDVVRRDVPTCRLDEPLVDVADRVLSAGWEVCFVTNAERIVLGRLDRPQLERGRGTAGEAMKPGPVTYRAHNPTGELAHLMVTRDIAALPVTTSDGALIGVVLRADIEGAHGSPAPDSAEEPSAEEPSEVAGPV